MDALEILGRALLVVCGLTAAIHFHLMSNAAQRAPMLLKYLTYPGTASAGLCAAVCAVVPGDAYLMAALWASAMTLAGALVVALAVWRAGVHVCDVMDSAAALQAAKKVQSVVGQAQREARVLGERMTFRTWDALASMEEDPRDKRRPQDWGRP